MICVSVMTSRSTVLGLGALAAVSVMAYQYWASREDSGDALPALTAEETEEVLQALVSQAKELVIKSQGVEANIKQRFASQGQQCDDAQLREHLLVPTFLKDFEAAEAEVLSTFDVGADELREAAEHFSANGSKQVEELSEAIKQCFRAVGGTVASNSPAKRVTTITAPSAGSSGQTLSLDDVLQLLSTLASILNVKTDEYITAYKSEHGLPQDQMGFQRFQMGMVQVSEVTEKEVLVAHGLTEDGFRQALMSYKDEQAVMEVMMVIQQQSQMILQKHGMMMQPAM